MELLVCFLEIRAHVAQATQATLKLFFVAKDDLELLFHNFSFAFHVVRACTCTCMCVCSHVYGYMCVHSLTAETRKPASARWGIELKREPDSGGRRELTSQSFALTSMCAPSKPVTT